MSIARRFFRAIAYGACGLSAASVAADAPRIVRLTSMPSRSVSDPIREPAPALAPASEDRPLESRRRREFTPISLPDAAPPIAYSPAPQLPEQPQFAASETPTANLNSAGPLLASPTAPPKAATQPAATDNPPATVFTPTPAAPQNQEPALQPPVMARPANSAAMQTAMHAVAQRAMQKADQAAAMAERGMLYSAHSELVQALQLIAQALDAEYASTAHTSALATGLTAIEEARDFAAQPNGPSEDFEVRAIAAGHRTQAFTKDATTPISPVTAQQKYLALAQDRFIEAAGRVPAASQILYRLGRLETAMAAHDADPLALHAPQAMVFHQAALATDGGNWLAANELGVLYARYGQLDAAKQLLLASVTAHPHVAGWQNLAAIHRRLGETDLAQRAEHERELAASKPGAAATDANAMVRWVDTKTFAATGGSDVKWPAEVANRATRR